MSNIPISQLPAIPSADLKSTTAFAARTTDSNGVEYTGKVTVEELFNDGGTGCMCVQVASLVIPSADMLTSYSTPVPFGITVPAGHIAVPVTFPVFRLEYGSVAYATNTNIHIRAVGATDPFSKGTSFLAATSDTLCPMSIEVGAGNAEYFIDGADWEVFVPTGNPTAGNSNITIYVTYLITEL